MTAVCVGPQARRRGQLARGKGEEGHTDYSSDRAGREVLPAIQLNLRLWERILDFRHLGCFVECSIPSQSINQALIAISTASMGSIFTIAAPQHAGRSIDTRGMEGRERRGEQASHERMRVKSSVVFLKLLSALQSCRCFLDKSVGCLGASPASDTSLAGCGLDALIGALTVQRAYLFGYIEFEDWYKSHRELFWEGGERMVLISSGGAVKW